MEASNNFFSISESFHSFICKLQSVVAASLSHRGIQAHNITGEFADTSFRHLSAKEFPPYE
jgi:hypothetical protein